MKRVVLFMALIALAAPVSAQELEIQVSPGEVWLGEAVEVNCVFSQEPGSSDGVSAMITAPIILELTGFSRTGEGLFSKTYTPPVIGEYTIKCLNGSLESPEEGFTVSSLVTEIVGYPQQLFTDKGIRIEATAKRIAGDEVQLTSGVGFSVTLNGEDLSISGFPYYYNERWVIDTEPPQGLGPGNYNLRLVAEYGGKQDWHEVPLDVFAPLNFRIVSVSPYELQGGENVTVELELLYHNTSVLSSSSLSARLDSAGLDIHRSSSGFSFTCPEIEPESHSLEVSIEYDGFAASDSHPIYYILPVHGEIRDASSRGVSARLEFLGNGWQKSIRTNVNGAFSLNVPAGTYTLDISFPASILARVEGFEVNQELSNFVRFDTFSSKYIDGIRVAKVFAMEFSEDFDRIVFSSDYDGSVVDDESELEVYTCGDWNLDSRTCSGSWDGLDFEIDATKNEVEFEVEGLSGFVVGKRGELFMEATLDRTEYASGQSVNVRGVVRDDKGNVATGVKVSYSSGSEDGYVKSNTNGIFSLNFPAPAKGGEHRVELKASKDFLKSDKKSLEFNVVTFKELAVLPPVKAEITEGSEAPLEVVVVNTGQEALEDFKIGLSGIPGEWYQVSPKTWDSLLPDEQKVVEIRIKPVSPSEEVYTVNVDVSCSGLEKSESFVLYVEPLEEETETGSIDAGVESKKETFNELDPVTVYLIGSQEATMNTVSLLISAFILFLIARRLRMRRSTDRAWLMPLMDSMSSEVIRRPAQRAQGQRGKKRPKERVSKKEGRNSSGHIVVEV